MGEHSQLLSWHAAHLRSMGHVELAAKVLRTRSPALNEVLAYIATDDRCTVADLQTIIAAGELEAVKPRVVWLATLGRVVALQALDNMEWDKPSDEVEFGLACLSYANQSLPRNQEHQQFHKLEIELLMSLGHRAQARRLLESNSYLQGYYYGYLMSELDHPTHAPDSSAWENWVEGFNRPFVENDLERIDAGALLQRKYNALSTKGAPLRKNGPKVSVIMTSYKPERHGFLSAVNSVLNQSWQNLELIIVDDASPKEFASVLKEAESLDPRVRLIKLATNGGTYRARNAGIAAATGALMTGQDSDDWSHPQRIANQVDYIAANPTSPGVVVEGIRVDDALHRVFPGRIPHGPCEVSFMLPTQIARAVGGYMDTRKGADGEFRRRVEKYTGREVESIEKPLYLIRVGHESLSKADFRPGWSHPARRAFWSSSRYWHETADRDELRLREASEAIPIPQRFQINLSLRPPHYDVVFIGDWRAYSGIQRAMIDEIRALKAQGRKVAVLHVESVMSQSREATRLCSEIQRMINSRIVDAVVHGDMVSTSVAIIYDPTILQFIPAERLTLTADLLIIRPDFPPPEMRKVFAYLPEECDHNARKTLSSRVIWAASDPAVKRLLEHYRPRIELHDELYPIVLRPQQWSNARAKLSEDVPVIGRPSENFEAHWPRDFSVSSALWPMDGTYDVRILGDARSFLRRYSTKRFPANWIVYRDDEIRPEAYMRSLDFFVYFPSDDYSQEFSREALEAAASGALVILPHSFRDMHGKTAIYSSIDETKAIISQYVSDPSKFTRTVHAIQKRLRNISFEPRLGDFLKRLHREYQSSPDLTEDDA